MKAQVHPAQAGACAALMVLLATGCSKTPAAPEATRPDWRQASIDGVAPLMSVNQVKASLDRYGYRQVPCSSDAKMDGDGLASGDGMSCYRSPTRPMQIALSFANLREGRRVENAFFSEPYESDVSDADRRDHNHAFAAKLGQRFGKPMTVSRGARFQIVYWRVPGGISSLPDMISTTIDGTEGANVTLTSFWAGSPIGGAGQRADATTQPPGGSTTR